MSRKSKARRGSRLRPTQPRTPARPQLAAPGGEQPGHRTDRVPGLDRTHVAAQCRDAPPAGDATSSSRAVGRRCSVCRHRSGDCLAYTALAAIAFVRRADKHWSYAWTVAFFGVCYSVYLTVMSLTILGSACPYCLTSLGLMTATLALVTMQRPPEMAHRSWVGLVAGRGALAAVVILPSTPTTSLRKPSPIGPEDPMTRALAEHLTEEGVLVLRRVMVSALPGAEATLRGVRESSSVHRMQPRRTAMRRSRCPAARPASRRIRRGSSTAGPSSARC